MSQNYLFRLPIELRLTIYRDVLCVEEGSTCFGFQCLGPRPFKIRLRRNGLTPQLLCVSQAVRKEATFILYAENGITFSHPFCVEGGVSLFFDRIGRFNASLIRNLRLESTLQEGWDPAKRIFLKRSLVPLVKILRHCTGLATMTLTYDDVAPWARGPAEAVDWYVLAFRKILFIEAFFREQAPNPPSKIVLEMSDVASKHFEWDWDLFNDWMTDMGWFFRKVSCKSRDDNGIMGMGRTIDWKIIKLRQDATLEDDA